MSFIRPVLAFQPAPFQREKTQMVTLFETPSPVQKKTPSPVQKKTPSPVQKKTPSPVQK